MKNAIQFFIFLLSLSAFVLLWSGCSKNNSNDIQHFMEIGKAFAKNGNQLKEQPGMDKISVSSDPSKKLFNVGVAIDHDKITNEHLKQIFESYLKNVASFAHEQDYKIMLKPYNLHIEEVDKGDFSLIAEKSSGSSEINWKEIK